MIAPITVLAAIDWSARLVGVEFHQCRNRLLGLFMA
jgi:hypothetical protein